MGTSLCRSWELKGVLIVPLRLNSGMLPRLALGIVSEGKVSVLQIVFSLCVFVMSASDYVVPARTLIAHATLVHMELFRRVSVGVLNEQEHTVDGNLRYQRPARPLCSCIAYISMYRFDKTFGQCNIFKILQPSPDRFFSFAVMRIDHLTNFPTNLEKPYTHMLCHRVLPLLANYPIDPSIKNISNALAAIQTLNS